MHKFVPRRGPLSRSKVILVLARVVTTYLVQLSASNFCLRDFLHLLELVNGETISTLALMLVQIVT